VPEDRRCRERDLEGVSAGDLGHESRLQRRRRVDRAEAFDDLLDAQRHVLAPGVPERDDVVRTEALDRVVEGVEEHPAAELAVGHHVKPEVDLPPYDLSDGLVLEFAKGRSILLALLGLDRRMPLGVEVVDGAPKRCGSQERPDDLGSTGAARVSLLRRHDAGSVTDAGLASCSSSTRSCAWPRRSGSGCRT
jgi:hypothetical protein